MHATNKEVLTTQRNTEIKKMAKYLLFTVLFMYFVQTEGSECCKAYTGMDGTWHAAQFCEEYCCLQLSTNFIQCCSKLDAMFLRVPESQRDTDCINWLHDHIWVPIVCGIVGLVILIALCTCCCCCGCCACCRNNKPGTVVVHQPPTALTATAVSVSNTTTNVNPHHVGYDY